MKKNGVLGTNQGQDTNAFIVGISKILNEEFKLIIIYYKKNFYVII